MRWLTLYCGKKHLTLWAGPWGLVLIARRGWPSPWLTWTSARRSGGTARLQLGWLVLIHQVRRR